MIERSTMRWLPVAVGAAAGASLLAADLMLPKPWREVFHESAYDQVLAVDQQFHSFFAHLSPPNVRVVDIDRPSLERLGPWPWPRMQMARLIDALASFAPAVIAIDILYAEPDARSPAALARELGALSGRTDVTALAEQLPDGDQFLAQAGSGTPLVFGFVLDPDRFDVVPMAPVVTRGKPSLEGLWHSTGAVGPVPALAQRANGVGALSLPANGDGVVRHVPLLVGAGGRLLPGLALEAIRIARGASVYLVESSPPSVATSDLKIPLSRDGLLRLLPVPTRRRTARALSAVDIIDHAPRAAALSGAIVLVGASAPELGGLRATPTDPLTPSVQIQADAVEQILAGRFPQPIAAADIGDLLLGCGLGALAIFAGVALAPLFGALAVIGLVGLSFGLAFAASILADRLIDPLAPSIVTMFVFVATSVTSFAVTHRREVLVRRRFEQHLAPAVVQRIVDQPSLVKLSGERREVTSLFTDVEGFTAMTHRADAQHLVTVLDAYFEGIAAIVIAHGGMVDKIVGDAVHALFNAPLDLVDHSRQAVTCAVALHAWTQSYRLRPPAAAIGFGCTRIGIESGQAIVGDVGLHTKLDYTAYGDAVNAAARFQVANKQLGSAICVGPNAAGRCDPDLLRPLGRISVRGRDEALAVFEPWPANTTASWRTRYLAAFAMIDDDRLAAAAMFEALAEEHPEDLVTRTTAKRLCEATMQ